MKIKEILEAKGHYYKAVHNGYPRGGSDAWMEKMGASKDDVQKAREQVLKTPEYKQMIDFGFTDKSGGIAKKNGSIHFAMSNLGLSQDEFDYQFPAIAYQNAGHVEYHILSHGRITGIASGEQSKRYPLNSPEPVIYPGDPVKSVVTTMQNSLRVLVTHVRESIPKRKKELEQRSIKTARSSYVARAINDMKNEAKKNGYNVGIDSSIDGKVILTGKKTGLDLHSLHADPETLTPDAKSFEDIIKAGLQQTLDNPKLATFFDSKDVNALVSALSPRIVAVKLKPVSQDEILDKLRKSK